MQSRVVGWLMWPVMILALPIFFVLAALLLAVLLVLFLPAGFRLFRAYRRLLKGSREDVLEVDYRVLDDEDKGR